VLALARCSDSTPNRQTGPVYAANVYIAAALVALRHHRHAIASAALSASGSASAGHRSAWWRRLRSPSSPPREHLRGARFLMNFIAVTPVVFFVALGYVMRHGFFDVDRLVRQALAYTVRPC
jgi:hypothetical protein